jgi:hypothetical protein
MIRSRLSQRLTALVAAFLLHGQPSLAGDTGPADRLETGRQALAPFQAGLQTALKEGLAKGPVEAVDACRMQAPAIARDAARAASAGSRLDVAAVELGRTSHRLRNPANAPREWVRPLLAAYLAQPGERAPRAVELGNGRWGYVQPIFVQPLCLTCHGSSVAEPLKARISALYPEDRAVGFRDGDFRGLFWAEFAAPR